MVNSWEQELPLQLCIIALGAVSTRLSDSRNRQAAETKGGQNEDQIWQRPQAGTINTTALNFVQKMMTAQEHQVPNLPRAQEINNGGVSNGENGGSILVSTHLHKSTWSSCPLRQRKPRWMRAVQLSI
jgi:hypothetical protein